VSWLRFLISPQGETGLSAVTLGSITIPSQQVSLVNIAAWCVVSAFKPPAQRFVLTSTSFRDGDNITSGLIGLSYPSITSVFSGNENSTSSRGHTNITYSPVISTLISDQLIQPLFSLALSRDESQNRNGGILELGGIPDLTDPQVNASSTFATTPILEASYFKGLGTQYEFYVVQVAAVVVDGYALPGNRYVVDSGTVSRQARAKTFTQHVDETLTRFRRSTISRPKSQLP
jgi:hypothetical protein